MARKGDWKEGEGERSEERGRGREHSLQVHFICSPFFSSAEMDYVAVNTTLSVRSVQKQCVTVQTSPDMIVEDDETLIIDIIPGT